MVKAAAGQGVDTCGDGSDGRALAASVKYQLVCRSGGHGGFIYVHAERRNRTLAAAYA